MATIQQINLFNPDFVPRHDVATARYLLPGVLLIVLLSGAGAWAARHFADGMAAREQALTLEMNAVRTRTEALTAQLNGRSVDAELERQLAERHALLGARKQVAQWLRADGAGSDHGVSEYLRALARQSMDGVWLTGFAVQAEPRRLSIEGRALKGELLPDYLGRLGAEALLKGRTFSTVTLDGALPNTSAEPSQEGMAFKLESSPESVKP